MLRQHSMAYPKIARWDKPRGRWCLGMTPKGLAPYQTGSSSNAATQTWVLRRKVWDVVVALATCLLIIAVYDIFMYISLHGFAWSFMVLHY